MDGRPMTTNQLATAEEMPAEIAVEAPATSEAHYAGLPPIEFISLGPDQRIGRVVSMSGAQAVVLMEESPENKAVIPAGLMMGTIVKLPMPGTMIFGIVSALSVPIPAREPGAWEMKIMELNLIAHPLPPQAATVNPSPPRL